MSIIYLISGTVESSFHQNSIVSDDDDDDVDGKMSLGEFLKTCNNSPQSRV